jgi:filamentous hemagglutinin family protein
LCCTQASHPRSILSPREIIGAIAGILNHEFQKVIRMDRVNGVVGVKIGIGVGIWIGGLNLWLEAAQAQAVAADGTLNTTVSQIGSDFTITNGTRTGSNLFHSFQQFSLPTGTSATFDLTQTPTVSTIFSRVTGSSVSNLDGLVQIRGGSGASLFLNGSTIVAGSFFGGGRASEVTINANALLVEEGGGLIGLNIGGKRGAIFNLNVKDVVFRNKVGFALGVYAGGEEAGDININADSVLVENQSGFSAETYAPGPAGDITIRAKSVVFRNKSGMDTNTDSDAPGGKITVEADSLTLQGDEADGYASIRAKTSGTGDAGTINLQVGSLILQNGQIELQSEAQQDPGGDKPGRAGLLNVVANSVQMGDRSLISASNVDGDPGALSLQVRQGLSLDQGSAIVTQAGGREGGTQPGGKISVQAGQVAIQGGAYISSSSLGQGRGGAIQVVANEVVIQGQGSAAAEIPKLNLTDQLQQLEEDFAAGAISATDYEDNKRGILGFLNALRPTRDRLNSGIFSDAKAGTSGSSGNITLQATGRVTLANGGVISTSAAGFGDAGLIGINARSLWLNQASIVAQTASGQGGNLNLRIREDLLLNQQSLLSAEAGGLGAGGNINLKAGVIVGYGNSDIVANAFEGVGGNIQITTQGLFGLQFRDAATPDNDVTASSKFGVSGTVEIKAVGVDPQTGLVTLPQDLIDPSRMVASGCASPTAASRFVLTGRGGMPYQPGNPLPTPWSDLRAAANPRAAQGPGTMPLAAIAPPPAEPSPLQEATTWQLDAQGQPELIASEVIAVVPGPADCWPGQ